MQSFISSSPDFTMSIAERLSKTLKGGEIIAMRGGLGMGKTCFVKGLAAGLGFKAAHNLTAFVFGVAFAVNLRALVVFADKGG